MKTKKNIVEFIPFFALLAASVVTLLIYLLAMGERDPVRISEACVIPLIALIIPALNRIFKINIPFSFNVAICVFSLLAVDLASVLNFYAVVPIFDKIMHTVFGIVGGFGITIMLMYGRGDKMKPWCFFIVVMLSVLGLAALWEIYEYTASAILGSDMQRWLPDFDKFGDMTVSDFFKNYNPLWDTIWDIIVAAFGVLIYYGLIFIDKLCGYKVMKSVYVQINDNKKIEENVVESVDILK